MSDGQTLTARVESWYQQFKEDLWTGVGAPLAGLFTGLFAIAVTLAIAGAIALIVVAVLFWAWRTVF